MPDRDEGALVEALTVAAGHLWSILGGLAVVGTVVMIGIWAYDFFGVPPAQRPLVALSFLFVLFVVGASLALFDLHRRLQDLRDRTDITALRCLAYEVLSGDVGHDLESDVVVNSMERTVDVTGEDYHFETHFEGQVAHGVGSTDGIKMKFLSDYPIDGADLEMYVERRDPPGEDGDPVRLQPDILYNDPKSYSVLLQLPFGDSLEEGEHFDVSFVSENCGRTPDAAASEVKLHFPNHRFRQVDEFDATVVLPNRYPIDDVQAASVLPHRDLSQNRSIRVEDMDLDRIPDEEIDDHENTDRAEYRLTFVNDDRANALLLFRFLRNRAPTAANGRSDGDAVHR